MFPSKNKRAINLSNKKHLSSKEILRANEEKREKRRLANRREELICFVQNAWRRRSLIHKARIEYVLYLLDTPEALQKAEQFEWILPVYTSLKSDEQHKLYSLLISNGCLKNANSLPETFPSTWFGKAPHLTGNQYQFLINCYMGILDNIEDKTKPILPLFVENEDYPLEIFERRLKYDIEVDALISILNSTNEHVQKMPLEVLNYMTPVVSRNAKRYLRPEPLSSSMSQMNGFIFLANTALTRICVDRSYKATANWREFALIMVRSNFYLDLTEDLLAVLLDRQLLLEMENDVAYIASYFSKLCSLIHVSRVLPHTFRLGSRLWWLECFDMASSCHENNDKDLADVYEIAFLENIVYWMRFATDDEVLGLPSPMLTKILNYITVTSRSMKRISYANVSRVLWLKLKLMRQVYILHQRNSSAFDFLEAEPLQIDTVKEDLGVDPELLYTQLLLLSNNFDWLSDDRVFNYYPELNDDEDDVTSKSTYFELPRSRVVRTLQFMPFTYEFYFRAYILSLLLKVDRSLAVRNRNIHPIDRDNLLHSARKLFLDLGSSTKNMQISFTSNDSAEVGIDGGGLTRELLIDLIPLTLSPNTSDVRGLNFDGHPMFVENEHHLLLPNPIFMEVSKYRTKEVAENFMFLGQIVGKCIYDGVLLDFEFAPQFLAHWTCMATSKFDDLKTIDPMLYKNLRSICSMSADEVDSLGLDFTVTGCQNQTIELREGGSKIAVTEHNKFEYAMELARYKMSTCIKRQTVSFLKGLRQIISETCFNMFNPDELNVILSGSSRDLDIDDLREHSVCSGFAPGSTYVDSLWDIVKSFTPLQKRKFLKFVTSVPRGPLLGFRMLEPNFGVRRAGENDSHFPTASTCVNLLAIPEYSSLELLRDRLLFIVENDHGFGLE